jgi:glycosyltransferase 2 family protein
MESTAGLGIKAACAVLSLSTLAMIVTPGGIGSFPIFVMETLTMYSIADTQGQAYGWLIWGVSTIIIIVTGLIALLVLPYINKKKNEKQQSNFA